jgi:hypothetical protein
VFFAARKESIFSVVCFESLNQKAKRKKSVEIADDEFHLKIVSYCSGRRKLRGRFNNEIQSYLMEL